MHTIQLHTMSRPTFDLLLGASPPGNSRTARMLACFRRALNLIVDDTVIALVTPELGNGPFHLLVDPLPPPLMGGQHPIWSEAEALRIGPWALQYTEPLHIWEPQPNWSRIWIGQRQRQRLRFAIGDLPTAEVRAAATPGSAASQCIISSKILAEAVMAWDLPSVSKAAATLCGLGQGLTPSGDDFLAGAMLALWAGHHPRREALCSTILESSVGRTTTLSAAFLVAAARGEANEPWHALLSALSAPPKEGGSVREEQASDLLIRCAVTKLSTYGATSGLDMLAGFEAGLGWCSRVAQTAARAGGRGDHPHPG